MRRLLLRLVSPVCVALLLLIAGCSGSGEGMAGGNPNEITPEQIERHENLGSAYTLVQRLRPNWLRKRGPSSVSYQSDIVVYVDGNRFGTPESLRNLNPINVQSMEFLSDDQANTRFGTGHDHGVILVHLRGSS